MSAKNKSNESGVSSKPKVDIFKWLTIFNTVGVLLLGVFLGYSYLFNGNKQRDPQPRVAHVDMAPLLEGAQYTGATINPKVNIVIFNSFTCGFCRKSSPVLNQVLHKYPDKVRLVYRHFIRNEVDLAAANAVECAGEQNKFWEMHDEIFGDNANEFNYKRYAQKIKINVDQFNKCVASNKYTNKARSDSEMGQQLGVQGTPTFVVNGDIIVGYRPFEAFDAMVKKAL
ncbi:MAG: DsbA family protein [Spirochaetia bacterium]|nr:DsbA family protein [Spirochaetia bacterium]